MVRRILVGAAIAGIAFIGSAGAASASTSGYPGPINDGNNILSQIGILNHAPVLNGVLNNVLNDNDIVTVAHLERIYLDLLSNTNHY